YFRSDPKTAELLETRPDGGDDTGLAGGGGASGPQAQQRVANSPGGLVSVVVAPDASISSVVINSEEVVLADIAEQFVVAAEAALQGAGAGTGFDPDARMAQFDAALAKIEKSLGDLDSQLDAALREL